MISVDFKRLCKDGERLPDTQQLPSVRGYLWIIPGCLIEGCGPVYRSLDAYFMSTRERPKADERGAFSCPRIGDTRTRAEDGVLMIYGTEIKRLGGGGIQPQQQIWACRPAAETCQDSTLDN